MNILIEARQTAAASHWRQTAAASSDWAPASSNEEANALAIMYKQTQKSLKK